MDYNRSIIVISENDNHAKLFTQLEPIRLSQGKGLAIKSIFHGTVYNINKNNNKVHYQITPIGKSFNETSSNEIISQYLTIPEGNYPDTQSILDTITTLFSELFDDGKNIRLPIPKFETVQTRKTNTIKITVTNLRIQVSNRRETPWTLLNIFNDITEENVIKIDNINFSEQVIPSFLYVNIVENSYINGKLSRNLSMIPLKLSRGWSFYEFNKPLYAPIDVQEFSKIVLEIRDVNGKYITFDTNFVTIITLHVNTINTESEMNK